MDVLTQIQQMYLQFCWAIKLNVYLDENRMKQKSDFDRQILFIKDQFFLPEDQFERIEDIILASENNVIINLGCYFIALDRAMTIQYGKIDLKNFDTLIEQPANSLKILIYMCRCAFAHDILRPKWVVSKNYQKRLIVNYHSVSVDIDLKALNDSKFEIYDIGGYNTVKQIHKSAENLLTRDATQSDNKGR